MPPFELLTFAGSLITGIFSRYLAAKQRYAHEQELAKLRAMGAQNEAYKDARAVQNPGIQWTRRVIALTVVFFVIAWPKLVVVFWPEVHVVVGYTEIDAGFWPFTSDKELIKWKAVEGGLALTPLDSFLLYAVAGFYLGKGRTS